MRLFLRRRRGVLQAIKGEKRVLAVSLVRRLCGRSEMSELIEVLGEQKGVRGRGAKVNIPPIAGESRIRYFCFSKHFERN